jgi:hypothetical protein
MQKPDAHKTSGCSAFANEGLEGKYSEKYFARNPKKKKIAGVLYLTYFDFDGERFTRSALLASVLSEGFQGSCRKSGTQLRK